MRRWNRPAFFSACVLCLVLLAAESSGAEPRSTRQVTQAATTASTAPTPPPAGTTPPAGAARPDTVERGSAPLAEADFLTAFHQPDESLYTGGQPTATQLQQAASIGITTVIDLRQPDEARGYDETDRVAQLGLHYVRIPVAGAAGLTPANVQALQTALTQASGPVLLHCASGNRVGALLALMKAQQGAPVDDALQFGREAGMTSLEAQARTLLEQDTAR